MATAWKYVPAALAFALLLYEAALPWTVPHFVTQDGPSHVYGAAVFQDLVVHHKTSIYSSLYRVQRKVLPNWTSTLVLAGAMDLAGVDHAEALFASSVFVLAFFAWGYAARAFSPGEPPWTPVANFLFQTWFLWIGFFNFYLGVALMPLVIGFYVRKDARLTRRGAVALACALLGLFLTHLIATAAALVVLVTIAFWVQLAVPLMRGENRGRGWLPRSERLQQFGLVLLAALPSVALMALFALKSKGAINLDPRIGWAWKQFPMHIFLTSPITEDAQRLLWKVLLGYAGLSALLFKKREWMSARGGLVISALLIFAAYLLVPDRGLGGNEAKIRFSWIFFVLAALVTGSASRLRFLRVPAALFFAWFVYVNTAATGRTAVAVSNVAADYLAVAGKVAPRSSLVRLRYPTPDLARRYGYEDIGRDPVFHLDALVAAGGHILDLSDYEALSRLFGVVYRPGLDAGELSGLWSFEGPDPDSHRTLQWISENFPVPVDYVIVVGDIHAPDSAAKGMPKMMEYLDTAMRPVAASPDQSIRLYRRRCAGSTVARAETAGGPCAP